MLANDTLTKCSLARDVFNTNERSHNVRVVNLLAVRCIFAALDEQQSCRKALLACCHVASPRRLKSYLVGGKTPRGKATTAPMLRGSDLQWQTNVCCRRRPSRRHGYKEHATCCLQSASRSVENVKASSWARLAQSRNLTNSNNHRSAMHTMAICCVLYEAHCGGQC